MLDLRVTFNSLLAALALFYATSLPAQEAEVLDADPNVLLNRLGTLTAPDDAREAKRLAREIEERWSHSGSAAMDLLLVRGREAMEAEDWPRALTHLTALTDHAPEWAEAWNLRATTFFLMDRFGPAISDIEQALILEPRHFGALGGLGIIMEHLGERDKALEAFRRAHQVFPAQENVTAAIERLERETGERDL